MYLFNITNVFALKNVFKSLILIMKMLLTPNFWIVAYFQVIMLCYVT